MTITTQGYLLARTKINAMIRCGCVLERKLQFSERPLQFPFARVVASSLCKKGPRRGTKPRLHFSGVCDPPGLPKKGRVGGKLTILPKQTSHDSGQRKLFQNQTLAASDVQSVSSVLIHNFFSFGTGVSVMLGIIAIYPCSRWPVLAKRKGYLQVSSEYQRIAIKYLHISTKYLVIVSNNEGTFI